MTVQRTKHTNYMYYFVIRIEISIFCMSYMICLYLDLQIKLKNFVKGHFIMMAYHASFYVSSLLLLSN